MKKVITYGTFDLLHHGHILLLERAKKLGDHLTVALSTDEFNLLKGKRSFFTFDERMMIVQAIRYVDCVIKETCWEQKIDDVIKHNIDIFVIGNDWEGKFDFLKPYCEVLYLERTPHVSSSQIREHYQSASEAR